MYLKMKVERLLELCYETVLRFKEVMENILLSECDLIIILVSSSTRRNFCNLCGLQKITDSLSHEHGLDRFQQWLNRCFATWVIPRVQHVVGILMGPTLP